MAEPTSPRGRRPRRSTRISQQLERVRQRNADQLAEQRAREQRVEQALTEFVEAGDAIATEEHACEEKVASYQRKIDELRAETQTKVADQHTRQERAALAIHEAGRTVDQVAELLELRSEKEARRLIAAGRTPTEADADESRRNPDESDVFSAAQTSKQEATGAVDREPPYFGSGEQAQSSEGDGQQHHPYAGLAPASVAEGGGQST